MIYIDAPPAKMETQNSPPLGVSRTGGLPFKEHSVEKGTKCSSTVYSADTDEHDLGQVVKVKHQLL